MAATQPAMSPSDLPVAQVLDRATGPRRAEADELLELLGEISGEHPVVWACDPMHANMFRTRSGIKTRSFDAIMSEVETFFQRKATDYDRWLAGMRKLQASLGLEV